MNQVMRTLLSMLLTTRIVTSAQTFSCKTKCGQTFIIDPCYCIEQCVVYKNCCEDFQTECPDVYRQGMSEFKDLVPLEVTCTTYDVLMISSCQASGIGDSGSNDIEGRTTGYGHLGSSDVEFSTKGYRNVADGSKESENVEDTNTQSDDIVDRTTESMHKGENTLDANRTGDGTTESNICTGNGTTESNICTGNGTRESNKSADGITEYSPMLGKFAKSRHMESKNSVEQFSENVPNQKAHLTEQKIVSTYYVYFLAAMINPPVQDIETQLVYKNFSIYKCNVKHSSNYLSWQAFIPDNVNENKDDVRIQYKPPSAVNNFYKNCIHSAISSCIGGQFWDKTTEIKCQAFSSYVNFKIEFIYRNRYCLYCHHGKDSRYEYLLRVNVLKLGLALTFLLKDTHTLKISSDSNARLWQEMTCSINDEMNTDLNALFDDDKRCKVEKCIPSTFLHASGKCHIPYYLRFAVYLDDKNLAGPHNFFSRILAFVLTELAHLDVTAIQENITLFNPNENKTLYSGLVVVHLPGYYYRYDIAIRYPREMNTVAVAFRQCWRKYSRILPHSTNVNETDTVNMEYIYGLNLPDDNSTQQSPDDRVSFCIAMSSADPIDYYCTVNSTQKPNTTILQNLLLFNCLTSSSQNAVSQFVYILFVFALVFSCVLE